MITVATYNILHDYYADLILENIALLIEKGVDVICLQEAESKLEKPLQHFLKNRESNAWNARYEHAGLGGNVALVWNSDRLQLQSLERILLPQLAKYLLIERITGHDAPMHRAALAGTFVAEGKVFRVTSVHLAWEGGTRHRLAQLSYLKNDLARHPSRCDIIGGDFNTVVPSFFRRTQQRKVEAVMGAAWTDVLPNLRWSFDLAYTAPQDGWDTLVKILHPLGVRMRARLDYFFARNVRVASAEMLDLPGSDHRPLIGVFEIS